MAEKSKTQWWARRPMEYLGQTLDRGQFFELAGGRNDEKLTRLGYCTEVPKATRAFECGRCGGKFLDEGMRDAHGKLRHSERPRALTPQEEDAEAERQERRLQELAPLNLENTAASRA